MEHNNSNGEECGETERRRKERRKRDEPVLLDTRAPRERREEPKRQDDEAPGTDEPGPDTRGR